ncbi:CaiB/BaiF CoA transferase family protein [Pollutimonas harenae]|uniref:CoA transferase n=1 Tax=Pollutimonas harenae TaxID=657015 RepID=A0A853H6F1_9BURK|nr:CoA transferase [Pollutimonas harenae]NYT86725.1 CoA transferase [Pollutimonas harenae]
MQDMKAWRPLSGIKVADFSVLLPGPLTTVLLADLGADVVKIEPPGGDAARELLPDLFRSVNRNKRSVVLDLKTESGREHAGRIAAWADVFIESSRPGVADRLGIGFEQLTAINPRLIYCSLSGYGQDGPWRDKPGHDLNYLAASGALAYPGTWGARPSRSSVPIADIVAGSLAASAILAAMRERDQTGQAARLDLSLFESALFCTALRHGLDEDADPTAHLFPGNDYFETGDGRMVSLGLLEDRFWEAFVSLVERQAPELADDKFATLVGRRQHGDELTRRLRALLKLRGSQEWRGLLEGSEVPFDICVTPAEAAQSPHIKARRRVASCDNEQFVPFPVTVNGQGQPQVHSAAPSLGDHTDNFLRGLNAVPDER